MVFLFWWRIRTSGLELRYQGREYINKEGAVEIKVDSKSPTEKDEPRKEKVEVNSDSGDKASNYANPGEALSSQIHSRSEFAPNK